MLLRTATVLLVLGCLPFALGQSQRTPEVQLPAPSVMPDVSSLDQSVDPCSDFYRYACGGWLAKNPVPADQTRWRRWNELAERNNLLLYKDLTEAASHPKNPLQRKYGDYFTACMDRNAANRIGANALQPILQQVDRWTNKQDLALLVGQLDYHDGQQLFFNFGVEQDLHDSKRQIANLQQGMFALPNREDYVTDDERSRSIRREYASHMERIFQLLGDSSIRASVEAKNVVAIETALAKSEVAESELFDPAKRDHLMSVSALQSLTPSFSWLTYLKAIHQPQLTSLNVENPKFLTGLQELIGSSTVDALHSYIRWSLVHRYASLMSDPFHQENFGFFSSTLEGETKEKPLWRQCTAASDGALGEAIGQDWVAENFPPSAKRSMEQMVDALREALRQQIDSLDWMSPATKTEAQAKLTHLRVLVGYPNHWRDYSSLAIVRDNAVANGIAVNAFNRQHDLGKVGHTVDLDEWFVTPPTVTAYTTFAENQSVFPAGILQPPFFSADADPAVNFGAMGSIIGHEMTHGFDTVGSKYDAQGNVRNWWTTDDRAHFDADAACIRNEYSGFTIVPGVQQDGRRTLGENIADNGGLLIAYKALLSTLAQRKDADTTIKGFSPSQRFFIGFAQFHCQNQTDQNIRSLAKSDPHSADEWRVNGTVRNMPEFSQAFGCKVGQPLAPANVCRVW